VDDPVFKTDHALHLCFKGSKAMAKGQEYQTGLLACSPRHGASQNEGLRSKAFLGGAFDVRGVGRVLQFLVVTLPATENVILLGCWQPGKVLQVMQPVLDNSEAAAIHIALSTDYGRCNRIFILRIF